MKHCILRLFHFLENHDTIGDDAAAAVAVGDAGDAEAAAAAGDVAEGDAGEGDDCVDTSTCTFRIHSLHDALLQPHRIFGGNVVSGFWAGGEEDMKKDELIFIFDNLPRFTSSIPSTIDFTIPVLNIFIQNSLTSGVESRVFIAVSMFIRIILYLSSFVTSKVASFSLV